MQDQNLIQNPDNFCERCGVVHTQEPVDLEKVAGAAIAEIVNAEDAEWRAMSDHMVKMGIDPSFLLEPVVEPTFFEQHHGQQPTFKIYPHQKEAIAHILAAMPEHRTMIAHIPREHPAQVIAGLSEGIFPISSDLHHGFVRGITRHRHPQLSQIPKSPEALKLLQERLSERGSLGIDSLLDGDYIPKAGSDARIMFEIDSCSTGMFTRMFERETYHALDFYTAQGQRCGKTTSMGHLMEYHKRANEQIYEGDPGRPKGNKAKRKAQKKARKGNRK